MRVLQVVQKCFKDGPQEIEDLWLSFFCISTNLTKTQPQVHQLGKLWQLVRASMTIVGMVPPVITSDGDMHVDGGYLNNIPVRYPPPLPSTFAACFLLQFLNA